MGYTLFLKITNENANYPLIFIGDHLSTAKIVEKNVTPNQKVNFLEQIFLKIDDKKNGTLLESNLKQKFFDWENGVMGYEEKDFASLQFLKFEINSIALYLFLCPGLDDSYCYLRILPISNPQSFIEGKCFYEGGYFEQAATLSIEEF